MTGVKKKLVKLLGLPILAIILWNIDFSKLAVAMSACRLELVFGAWLCTGVALLVKSLRWHLMLRHQEIPYSLGRSVTAYFSGVFVGIVTPGRLGELTRGLYLKRDLKIDAAMGLSSIIMDRLWDFYALLIVGLIAAARFELFGRASGVSLLLLFGAAAAPIALLNSRVNEFFVGRVLGRVVKEKLKDNMLRGTKIFIEGTRQLIGPRMAIDGALTVLAYGLVFSAAWLLVESLGISLSFTDAALTLGLANFLSLIPITVAGVGTRDAVFVFIFATLGFDKELALGFSLLALGVFYLGSGFFGSVFFWLDSPPSEARGPKSR